MGFSKDESEFYKKFMNWPEPKKQCMLRGATQQCVNEAQFTVGFRNGMAQDVCRDCLPVACERANDEVVVMKLRRPDGTPNIRMP